MLPGYGLEQRPARPAPEMCHQTARQSCRGILCRRFEGPPPPHSYALSAAEEVLLLVFCPFISISKTMPQVQTVQYKYNDKNNNNVYLYCACPCIKMFALGTLQSELRQKKR